MTKNRNSRRAWWEVGMYSSPLGEVIFKLINGSFFIHYFIRSCTEYI